MNLISNSTYLGELLTKGVFDKDLQVLNLANHNKNKNLKKNYDQLKWLNTFSWLYTLSELNTQNSRDFAKNIIVLLDFAKNNFSPIIWDPEITGLRLCSICLNINFLNLCKVFPNRRRMMSSIIFHVIYLFFSKVFVSKGLPSLRINAGFFFASLLLGETILKRHRILRNIVSDILFLVKKKGEIESRNPDELLEILFLINRFIKFSSTSDLSRGKIEEKLKILQNQIVPVLRGLRLGNGQLVRANLCGGESIYWNLDKELYDAKPKDFSIRKNSMGFYRISAGRLKIIFDGQTKMIRKRTHNYFCSAFSFEVTSGQRTILQNNSPFNSFLGHSDNIFKVKREFNSVGFFKKNDQLEPVWFSKIKEVNNYKNLNNNYLEGEKIINIDDENVIHSRKLMIPFSGNEIIGSDLIFSEIPNIKFFDSIILQFFVHPEVDVWNSEKSKYFLLKLKNNEIWRFETDQNNCKLDTYNYLDPKDLQTKKAFRIVLEKGFDGQELSVNWKFYLQNYTKKIAREKITL